MWTMMTAIAVMMTAKAVMNNDPTKFNSYFLQQISVNLSVFRVHCYSVLSEHLPFFWITLHAKKGNTNHIYGESFTKFIVNS